MKISDFDSLSEMLTRALLHADFVLYQSVMCLPLRIVPRGGSAYILQTPDELRADFDIFATAISAAQITDIFREVQEIAPHPSLDDAFKITCHVHIFHRAHRIAEPFLSEFVLRADPQGFCITEALSSPDHIDWTLGQRPIGPGNGLI